MGDIINAIVYYTYVINCDIEYMMTYVIQYNL